MRSRLTEQNERIERREKEKTSMMYQLRVFFFFSCGRKELLTLEVSLCEEIQKVEMDDYASDRKTSNHFYHLFSNKYEQIETTAVLIAKDANMQL